VTKRGHRWSADVNEHSDTMNIDPGTFRNGDPHHIALALKHAGKNLSDAERTKLDDVKPELRKLFGRSPE